MNSIEVLNSKGVKPTITRTTVLDILASSQTPLSRQEVLKQSSLLKLDPITVYRTLGLLEDSAIIHKVTLDDRSWKYFILSDGDERLAIVECVQCGNVDRVALPESALVHALPTRFKLLEANIQLKVICTDCATSDEGLDIES